MHTYVYIYIYVYMHMYVFLMPGHSKTLGLGQVSGSRFSVFEVIGQVHGLVGCKRSC